MANSIISSSTAPTITPYAIEPHLSVTDQRFMTVAHEMVETYCGKEFPLVLVTASYQVDDLSAPLPAVPSYTSNRAIAVEQGTNNENEFTFNGSYIFPLPAWSGTPLSVRYIGGIPATVFDAIQRTGRMLADRPATVPEMTEPGLGGSDINPKFDPRFRSGLASDVKAMLVNYKMWAF